MPIAAVQLLVSRHGPVVLSGAGKCQLGMLDMCARARARMWVKTVANSAVLQWTKPASPAEVLIQGNPGQAQ